MSNIQVFEYNGQKVEFEMTGKNVMVNATEMAKIFDRRIDIFLKTEPTKAFIKELQSTIKTIELNDNLLIEFPPISGNSESKNGANLIQTKGQNGTWMHRVLALKFAAWLNPKFEVWVYYTIENLLFGEAAERKQLLSESIRLKNEISELEAQLSENDIYKRLVDRKAQLMRLGKDLKANDVTSTEKQLELFNPQ